MFPHSAVYFVGIGPTTLSVETMYGSVFSYLADFSAYFLSLKKAEEGVQPLNVMLTKKVPRLK
jgi:hypothetical protein